MKAKPLGLRRRSHRGQAVVWFLATLAACCATLALVYNVGQVANKKEETTNAADAAALSGAMVEARMLNFQAYTNRAIISNEVTIAQLISIDSWIQYNYQLTNNIATYTAPIPYVNTATQTAKNVMQVVATVVHPVVQGAVFGIDTANDGLLIARDAVTFTGAAAANGVADRIAGANSTRFNGRYDEAPDLAGNGFAFATNQLRWSRFTDSYTGNGRADAKEVVLNSRDAFSTKREEGYLIDALNLGLKILGGYFIYPNFDKTSGTTTLQGYDSWAAQDSLDLTRTGPEFPFGYGTSYEIPPIAYGRVDANRNNGTGDNLCEESIQVLFDTLPTWNCQYAMDRDPKKVRYGGLSNIRDLARNLSTSTPCSRNNGSDSPSLTYVMAVEKSANAALTTQRLGMNVPVSGPQGSPHLADNMDRNELTSISAACVFFMRPDRNARDITARNLPREDGRHEFASLYNPYWQARLTAPDRDWTRLLYLSIGKPGLDAALR
jgi:Putative Flp pilus-assembly TadE/G-like